MNITDPIRQHAQSTPNAPAIVRTTGRVVTYAELDRTIDAIAHRALGLGLEPGDVAGLAIENTRGVGATYAILALSLGLARAGMAAKIMSASGAPVALCFVAGEVEVPDDVRTVAVDRDWLRPPEAGSVAPMPSFQDGSAICRIFPTSGTTGVQREVAVSHDLMAMRVRQKKPSVVVRGKPILAAQLGAGSGYGFRNLLYVLAEGGSAALVRTPAQVIAAIERMRVNWLAVAPGTLPSLIDEIPAGSGPYPWLDLVEVGGAHLAASLYERTRARLATNIRSSYGSTEVGSVAEGPMAELIRHPGAVGFVIPGCEVQAVDEGDQPLPPGTEGILRIRGPGTVDGYVNDPAGSAAAFRNGWFHPGDLGTVSAEGMVTVTGRVIDIINKGGTKVSPRVIEEALLAVPGVTDAAAFGVPEPSGATSICAAIVTDERFSRTALRAAARGLDIAAPSRVMRMRSLPRNENGKVLRSELVKLALESPQRDREQLLDS